MNFWSGPLASIVLVCGLAGLSRSQPAMQPSESKQEIMPPVVSSSPAKDQAPSVDFFIKEALKNSPSLDALKNRLRAAKELIGSASALENPMLELMIQDVGIPEPTDMSMAIIEFRQPLPYPGKRAARGEVATAETSVVEAQLMKWQRRLISRVRILYARFYSLDKEREALRTALEMLRLLSASVTSRYETGQAEMEPLMKARLSTSRLEERMQDLEKKRSDLIAALDRLLGGEGKGRLGEVTALPSTEIQKESLLDRALAKAPELALRRSSLNLAERKLQLARLNQDPDFSLGIGGGVTYGAEPVVILRFGVELPIFNGTNRDPQVRSEEYELQFQNGQLRDTDAAVRSEVNRLLSEWQNNQEQIIRYRDVIIPQSSAALDAARAEYFSGRGDFSMVLEDFNLWIESRAELARREANCFGAWAGLEELTAEDYQVESEKGALK